MVSVSPLRYPGGKQVLSDVLATLISANGLEGGAYAEPYAGGAGAALALLFSGYVSKLYLNDADPCVYSIWRSILEDTESFCRLINDTPLTIEEWRRQKKIYQHPADRSTLELGFATFFLNRTNRSGIIKNAGPIGGYSQGGDWKIDVRFTRAVLAKRIQRIALYRKRISFDNKDALAFIGELQPKKLFVYFDPPYFLKGSDLYLNHYEPDDHQVLANLMKEKQPYQWIMSYDDVPQIRTLYKTHRQVAFSLSYSANKRRIGKELLILNKGLLFPPAWRSNLVARAAVFK